MCIQITSVRLSLLTTWGTATVQQSKCSLITRWHLSVIEICTHYCEWRSQASKTNSGNIHKRTTNFANVCFNMLLDIADRGIMYVCTYVCLSVCHSVTLARPIYKFEVCLVC